MPRARRTSVPPVLSLAETPFADLRSTDRLALNLFCQLRACSSLDRAYVADQIHRLSETRPVDGRFRLDGGPARSLALAALQAFRDVHGDLPSRARYDAWLARDEAARARHVTSNQIRGAFGGWSAAVEAAGGEATPAALAYRMKAMPGKLDREQALALLRVCARDTGQPCPAYPSVYRPWAKAELRRRPRRFEVVAISRGPFRSLFGSWAGALAAAGLMTRRAGRFGGGAGSPAGPREAYTQEAISEVLREAARDLGRPPAGGRYAEWRQSKLAAAQPGELVVLPVVHTITARFGNWNAALAAAGLISERQARTAARRSTALYDRSELLAVISAAAASLGWEFTGQQYVGWRESQLRSGAVKRLPCMSVLTTTFGSVAAARAAAQGAADGDAVSQEGQGPPPRRAPQLATAPSQRGSR